MHEKLELSCLNRTKSTSFCTVPDFTFIFLIVEVAVSSNNTATVLDILVMAS